MTQNVYMVEWQCMMDDHGDYDIVSRVAYTDREVAIRSLDMIVDELSGYNYNYNWEEVDPPDALKEVYDAIRCIQCREYIISVHELEVQDGN